MAPSDKKTPAIEEHVARRLRRQVIEQQALLDLIPAMVWIKDPENVIIRTNRAAAALLGLTTGEVEGRSTYELYPRADAEKYHRDDLEVIRSGRPKLGIIEQLQTTGNEKRWIQTDKVPYFDDDGKVIGVVVFAQDVTDRKREEEWLQNLARGLRSIIEMADELIMCPDMDTFYRRAVELARERLHVERCAIFMFEERVAWGTFGTDLEGHTTDERKNSFVIMEEWEEHFATIRPEKSRWVLKEGTNRWNWDGERSTIIGQGWVSYTAIARAGRRAIALFIHDAAITQAPFDTLGQELVAVYCSLLAEIIEQKRSEEVLRTSEANFRYLANGLRAVIDIADELMTCPDVDTIYRRVVELVRTKLGVERAALFIEDGDMIQGTYGTGMDGATTDERSLRFRGDEGWRSAFREKDAKKLWRLLPNAPIYAWTGKRTNVVGQGWVACTPIAQPGQVPLALLCNDAAISRAPFDAPKQDLLAVLCSMLANVLQRRHAEDVLRESERKFRSLADTIEASIFLFQGSRMVYANPAAARISGYPVDELTRMNFWDVVHPGFRKLMKRRGEARQRGLRVPARYEVLIRTKQGEERWVQYASRVITFGGAPAVLGVAFDITARKRAEEALRSRVAFDRLISRMSADLSNATGRSAAASIRKALGQIGRYLGVQNVCLTMYSDDRARITEAFEYKTRGAPALKPALRDAPLSRFGALSAAVLSGKNIVLDDSVKSSDLTGHARTLSHRMRHRAVLVVPVKTRGRVCGSLIAGHGKGPRAWLPAEIALLKLAGEMMGGALYREHLEEEHTRLANKVLLLQEEERRELSGVLHDEIGQVLTLTAMELRAAAPLPAKMVRRAARRLEDALQTVRNLAASLRPPVLDDLGIASGLKSLCREFNRRASSRVAYDGPSSAPVVSDAVATCLYRVLQEALTNAARHAGAKHVNVTFRVKGREAVLEVQDDGRGFNVSALSRRRGVGLIGMKERVASCGGELDIRSGPGEGTRIRARLPRKGRSRSRRVGRILHKN